MNQLRTLDRENEMNKLNDLLAAPRSHLSEANSRRHPINQIDRCDSYMGSFVTFSSNDSG